MHEDLKELKRIEALVGLEEIQWRLQYFLFNWDEYVIYGFVNNNMLKDTKKALQTINKLIKERNKGG